jgi:Kef-type K+ transport system membrane component KefB
MPVWGTIGGALLFVLLMIFVVKPLLARLASRLNAAGSLTDDTLAAVILMMLLSALVTEWLGIHLLFGAFLMGTAMPKDAQFVRYLQDRFESITVVLLLPIFFAFTGLRTSIGLVHGTSMWLMCALITAVAITGKLGGSMAAARLSGAPWRTAAAVGVLMNTRGLMELVILNIGLDIGVLSPALFSMMVLMALITTFMTTPLLYWVYPVKLMQEPAAETRVA